MPFVITSCYAKRLPSPSVVYIPLVWNPAKSSS